MGAELARKRKRQRTKTGMSEDQLRDYARATEKRKLSRRKGR
jgi:hypothetical protein